MAARVGVVCLFLACTGGGSLTTDPPACRLPPCRAGESRCQNACVRRLANGDSCSPTLDCTQPICGDDLVCHAFFFQDVCVAGTRVLSPCTPADSLCAVGLYCEPTRDIRPVRPGDPPGYCVPWLSVGQQCALANGDRLTCEPGLVCVGGFCRRPCQTSEDCPCSLGQRCEPGNVVGGDPSATFCIACADDQDGNALCSPRSGCCRPGSVCGASNAHPGTTACCGPVGEFCVTRDDCCAPADCQLDPARRGRTCCLSPGSACTAGQTCCGGSCCNGRCLTCDRNQGLVLDDRTCSCVPRTCALDRSCPQGGVPDPTHCTCVCTEPFGLSRTCCALGMKDCGEDALPQCVDLDVPCPPRCWAIEAPLPHSCGPGQTCCGYTCHQWPAVACCDTHLCPVDAPVCCLLGCCRVGQTCCGFLGSACCD